MCTLAWSWTEIVRFTFYTLKQFNAADDNTLKQSIEFFRYNSFLVLYPLGVSGELLSSYHAWSHIKDLALADKPWVVDVPDSGIPKFDFVEYSVRYVMPLVYLVFFPKLFMHMLK